MASGPGNACVSTALGDLAIRSADASPLRRSIRLDLVAKRAIPAYAGCSMIGASPARVVRRTSRTSLRSKRRARCIVVRLSHITRS